MFTGLCKTSSLPGQPVLARTTYGVIRRSGGYTCTARVQRAAAGGAAVAPTEAENEYRARRYKAEFHMMYNCLGGIVQQAVAEAVSGVCGRAGGHMSLSDISVAAPRSHRAVAAAAKSLPSSTPAGMTSTFLRCLDAQLQAKKFMSGGDEAGDVLGSFPSASLFSYPGGGLQGVVEHLAAAATEVRGPAAPAAAAVVRSLAGAVGRLAAKPNAEVAQGKAVAVTTCLDGMAEALEGATKGTRSAAAWEAGGAPTASKAVSLSASDLNAAAAMVYLEAGQLLREVAAVLDCIAGGSPDLPASQPQPHPSLERGHTLSPSTPAHPLLSAVETRLYGDSTWRSDSAAEIAASLVDFVAALLAPSRAGNTSAAASVAARGAACAALHSLARAQNEMAAAVRVHRAEPAAVSRLLAALAEALAAACITRDAADPTHGPSPVTMFGEAQLLLGLAHMAAGEAIAEVVSPGGAVAAAQAAAAAVAADAAAGDASSDRMLLVSDSSLVLEVLAAQAHQVAATHCDHIAQVLQDLRSIPASLGTLSSIPTITNEAAVAAQDLLRRATARGGTATTAEAAAAVAADNQAAAGGNPLRMTRAAGGGSDATPAVANAAPKGAAGTFEAIS